MREILLNKFQREVLNVGSDQTLPVNLSDDWLSILIKQGEATESCELNEEGRTTEFMAALFSILGCQNNGAFTVTEEELFDYVELYRVELATEELSRKTDFKISPATMENILTNRDIEVRK